MWFLVKCLAAHWNTSKSNEVPWEGKIDCLLLPPVGEPSPWGPAAVVQRSGVPSSAFCFKGQWDCYNPDCPNVCFVFHLSLSRDCCGRARVCVRSETRFPGWPEVGWLPCRLWEVLPHVAFFKVELSCTMWFFELLSKFKNNSRARRVPVAAWERNQVPGK